MKKKIIFTIVLVAIVLLGIFLYSILKEGKYKDYVVHDITFSDISISKEEDDYVFKVTLKTNKDVIAESFDVEIKDSKGKNIDVLSGYIGNITKDEIKTVEIKSKKNIKKAHSFVFSVYSR